MSLKGLVQECMNDLTVSNGLGIVEISGNEVLLKSDTYTLDVIADRDGVSMVYFDKSAGAVEGYNVFLFLANKRRGLLTFSIRAQKPSSYVELVETEVASLAEHLRNAGQDLLAGSKEWIRNYPWPTVSPSGSIAALV